MISCGLLRYLICTLLFASLGLYAFLVYQILYKVETTLLVDHAVTGDTLPPLVPRKWLASYIICCKDLGRPDSDEKMLLMQIGNLVSVTAADPSAVEYAIAGRLLEAFVSRKLDVNHVYKVYGLSALHSGVIGNQEWFVNKLLDLGADPCVRTSDKRKNLAGLTAIELAKTLEPNRSVSLRLGDEHQETRMRIINTLGQHSSTKGGVACDLDFWGQSKN